MTLFRSAHTAFRTLNQRSFLFGELVKRDFKQKYKRTILGALWSVLNPLLTLLVMRIVFLRFFGRNTPHYTVFLFAGTIVMTYFKDATSSGMQSLVSNFSVISKINIPKYLFILSRNVSALLNFVLTVFVFLIFCALDRIPFTWRFFLLVVPVICAAALCLGIGMILSCLFVFFRDMDYLYSIFLTLLTYLSGIFYNPEQFGDRAGLFLLNPVYVLIKYIRVICIDGNVPSLQYHLLMVFYPLFFLLIGCRMYRRYNHQFIYYM